jgi:hypothetical protein
LGAQKQWIKEMLKLIKSRPLKVDLTNEGERKEKKKNILQTAIEIFVGRPNFMIGIIPTIINFLVELFHGYQLMDQGERIHFQLSYYNNEAMQRSHDTLREMLSWRGPKW